MTRGDDTRETKRTRLIQATSELLEQEGLGGLSLRRIADACDTSTQAIYTIFGSKGDLLRALWEEGFDQLADALAAVDDEFPPADRLRAVGESYRQFALDHPALYEAMFARSLEEYRPASADAERDTRAFEILLDCVRDCAEVGYYGNLEPRAVADALWTSVHGSVELELSGYYDDDARAKRQFDLMLTSVGIGLRQIGTSNDEE